MQIWPPCRWPARTRSNAPGGRWRTTSGKWKSRMRRSASGSASWREAAPVRAKALVTADDLHGLPVHRAEHRVVLEQDCARLLDDRRIRLLRERVARDLDVVVSKDGEDAEARVERRHRRFELRLTPPPGEKVAGDRDDVARLLRGPAQGALERPAVERDRPQVEVGQVDDGEPVELEAGGAAARPPTRGTPPTATRRATSRERPPRLRPAAAAARRSKPYASCERMLSRSRARAASISRRSCSVRSRPPFVSGPPPAIGRTWPRTAATPAAAAAPKRRNLRDHRGDSKK